MPSEAWWSAWARTSHPGFACVAAGFSADAESSEPVARPLARRVVQGDDLRWQHRSAQANRLGNARRLEPRSGLPADADRWVGPGSRSALPQRAVHVGHDRPVQGQPSDRHHALRRREHPVPDRGAAGRVAVPGAHHDAAHLEPAGNGAPPLCPRLPQGALALGRALPALA